MFTVARIGLCVFVAACMLAVGVLLAAQEPRPVTEESIQQQSYDYHPSCLPPLFNRRQHYHQPVYHQQVHYPVQKVIAQEIAVAPLIVTVPIDSRAVPIQAYGAPYYYSVGDAYQQKALLREVIREELRSFTGNGHTQPVQPPVVKPPMPMNGGAKPVSWLVDDATPADLQTKVLEAFTSKVNCVKCHGGGAEDKGGFKLVLPDGQGGYRLTKQPSDKRWKIYGMASVGAMPPEAAADAAKAMESKFLPDLLRYAALKD